MLDSINVGRSGLMSFSQGLKLVANNTTNLNTPGFKASAARFEEMTRSGAAARAEDRSLAGGGVLLPATGIDFRPGELKQTGRSLDLAIEGEGFFALRDESGELQFTRAGQFRFNSKGVLVDASGNATVCGRTEDGSWSEISIAGRSAIAGEPTQVIAFAGNVSSVATDPIVTSARVIDASGVEHSLTVRLSRPPESTGNWLVELLKGETLISSANIQFAEGRPVPAQARATIAFAGTGAVVQQLTLDFSSDVTSFASGSLSSLTIASQDGAKPGALSGTYFDETGTLNLEYSNGKVQKGSTLLLAQFKTPESAAAIGGSRFLTASPDEWRAGSAGQDGFGTIASATLELSNVDLSREFSELVVMQRGYQAASQVISTANEMLQELFAMKNK